MPAAAADAAQTSVLRSETAGAVHCVHLVSNFAAGEAEAALVPPAAVVQCDGPFRHERRWQGAGLAAPVFALRTRRSVGVGEFADIKQLADFGSAAGVFMHRRFTPFNACPAHVTDVPCEAASGQQGKILS